MSRAKNILIALDQLINAVCGGWPDETISSRAWRWEERASGLGRASSLTPFSSLTQATAGKATNLNAWDGNCLRRRGRKHSPAPCSLAIA